MGVVHSDRPEPSTGFIERFCLLSYHGTILGRDRNGGSLFQRAISRPADRRDLHVGNIPGDDVRRHGTVLLDGDGRLSDSTADHLSIVRHASATPGRSQISLKQGDLFITADSDGTVRNDSIHCRDWEIFLLVRAEEVEVLGAVLSSGKYLTTATGETYDLCRSRVTSHYVLCLEKRRIDLRVEPDLVSLLRGMALVDAPQDKPEAPRTPPINARSKTRPRIHVTHLGMTANRILQYLVAENLRSRVDGAVVSGVDLPEWSIRSPAPLSPDRVFVKLGWNAFDFDLPGLGDCLARNVIDTVHICTYPFNIHLYPSLSASRALLPQLLSVQDAPGFGPRELVCNIRGGDILNGIHGDYLVLPPSYYRSLQERSGLELVFFGQLDDNPYTRLLHSHFPRARFIQGRSPQLDFEMLRRSRHIATSISTFSWLAAWLGEAETVYMPIAGMFSPVQYPAQSFLPPGDARYRYTLFPYAKMVDIYRSPHAFASLLGILADFMKPISVFEAEQICSRAARFRRPFPRLKGFDNDHYLTQYPDVATSFVGGAIGSPLQHYLDVGFLWGLTPRRFDGTAYLDGRPDIAMAIAEGHFADPLHHAMS